MSNTYTHFCEALVVKSEEEQRWVIDLAQELEEECPPTRVEWDGTGAEPFANIALRVLGQHALDWPLALAAVAQKRDNDLLVILSDGGDGAGDPFTAGLVVREYFRRFGVTDKRFALQYAETCDRLLVGAFSGGVVLVTHDEVHVVSTGYMVDDFLETGRVPYE